MWVCKANMLGDGLAIPHHRWERVLLGRAGWMPGALLGSQQAFPMGAYLYLHTPIHTCCMYAVCAIHVEQKRGGAGCPPTLPTRGWSPACRGDTGGHREGTQQRGCRVHQGEDVLLRTRAGGLFPCVFPGGIWVGASIFNFKSCLEKKVKFSIKAFFVCSFCKHLMVIG